LLTNTKNTAACDNSGEVLNFESEDTLYYNDSGDVYDGPGSEARRIDLARTTTKDLTNRPCLWFEKRPYGAAGGIGSVSQCPDTNTGNHNFTADPSAPGRFKLDFSVPTSADTEWGWDFTDDKKPPKLRIKIRIKRPAD
jgi:hypothetical protein